MILASGDDTGGHLGLIADVVPAGHAGPPLHLHRDFDEGFYIVEGELVFRLGEEVRRFQAGELALARRGIPHTFANRTDRDTRILMLVTPAGFERWFSEGAARARPPDDLTVVVGPVLDPAAPERG